jgi:hypothetical protein
LFDQKRFAEGKIFKPGAPDIGGDELDRPGKPIFDVRSGILTQLTYRLWVC